MFKKQITWILAAVLALAVVIGGGLYARDSKLRASDENVYTQNQETKDGDMVQEGEASRVQAIILTEDNSDEDTAANEEASEEIKEEKKVVVSSNMDGIEEAEAGTEVVLSTELQGFGDAEVTFRWQYSVDGSDWMDIEGANADSYSFELTEETVQYYWRVIVSTNE